MKLCVFAASSRELAQAYYDAAFELGAELARRGHTLVCGGGTSGRANGRVATSLEKAEHGEQFHALE